MTVIDIQMATYRVLNTVGSKDREECGTLLGKTGITVLVEGE